MILLNNAPKVFIL